MNLKAHKAYEELKEIVEEDIIRHTNYEGIIHLKEEDIDVVHFKNIDVERNYVRNYCSIIHVSLIMNSKDILIKIHEEEDNLEFTLLENEKDPVRYKAILDNNVDTMEPNRMKKTSEAPDVELGEINLQLVELPVEPLSLLSIGGIFTSPNRTVFLKDVIEKISATLKIKGKKPIDEVNIDSLNNESPMNQVVIPTNIPLLSLPSFINEEGGGMYVGGVGSFIQRYQDKLQWFIYPPYDNTRYQTAKNKLIIYTLDQDYPNLWTNSYDDEEEGKLKIVASITPANMDNKRSDVKNRTYGTEVINSDKIFKEPVKATDSSIIFSDETHIKQVHKVRNDNLDIINRKHIRITSNDSTVSREALINSGHRFDVLWHHSDFTLLRPNMKTLLFIEGLDGLWKHEGVLSHTHTIIGSTSKGLRTTKYVQSTKLTIFAGEGKLV